MADMSIAVVLAAAAFVAGLIVARLLWSWVDARRLARAALGEAVAASPGVWLKWQRRMESELGSLRAALDEREQRLEEFRSAYEQRAGELDVMRRDVRDAVAKTRELREELIDRATESARERQRIAELAAAPHERHTT